MQILDTTQQQMFALLRSSLWGVDKFPLQISGDVDWEAVYKELKDQTVNRLVADVLCPLNTPVSQKCLMDTTYGIVLWHSYMKAQCSLHKIFEEHNVSYAVLKGASSAVNYPKPTYRSMGDIDVLVRPEQFENVINLLKDKGYTVKENHSFRHAELLKDSIEIEVHRCYSMFSDKSVFEYFENELLMGLDNTIETQIEGYTFNTFSPIENGLVLLEHVDHHLQGGIGLRQIVDWMVYVDKYVSDDVWENTFGPKAKKTGLETLAITITRMCQMYLGLREDITWCNKAEDQLCTELMKIILARGNFGHKDKAANKIATVLHYTSGIKGTFRMLQYRGEMFWPAVKKYPWLKPFAWLHHLANYIRKGFKIKNPFRSFVKQVRATAKQKDVYEKLGATKKSEGIETPQGKRF
ncbi:MAG: nucleotidyltransferase family protein [Clostridia bacterium]|nr:nucleotidyltransferase family protein [Clostridia bacterium]